MKTATVALGKRSYTIYVGSGTLSVLSELIPPNAKRVAVVTQKGIPHQLELALPCSVHLLGDGEGAKSMSEVERLCREFAAAGLSRGDLVVAVGGGVVTDAAGFAASIYHRGVALINVATTLLAMVDAAIGGKTGVNIEEGKNLLGTFWQPLGVICDTDFLSSLPLREVRCGYGEMAKYRFLGVDDLPLLDLEDQILACVKAKAEVVSHDEREGGRRALLNYGHTLAHAIEACGFYSSAETQLAHGEAVAIGLVFAARLAHRLGRIDDKRVAEHVSTVESYGLEWRLPRWAESKVLMEYMWRDKKAAGSLTFVLDGLEGCQLISGLDPTVVAEVLDEFSRV